MDGHKPSGNPTPSPMGQSIGRWEGDTLIIETSGIRSDDPGFLRCEPWGLARQMFARHQLEIRQRGNDRLELRYGEWDAHRTIFMDGHKPSGNPTPSPMGQSIGRWEGDTLIIETSGI